MSGARALVLAVAAAAGAALGSGCENPVVDDRALEIDATGTVVGQGYLDLNGTGEPDEGDRNLTGAEVRLVEDATGSRIAEAVTDTLGRFRIEDVPVGSFRFEVAESLRDTLEIIDPPPAGFAVSPSDTTVIGFGATYPSVSLAEARTLPEGRRVFVEGIALDPRARFGPGLVHLSDGEAYLRAVDVPRIQALPGDSLRILGLTARRSGVPVLAEPTPHLLAERVALPEALEVSTAAAAGADDGSLDAALVVVDSADIAAAEETEEGIELTASDGSGEVGIFLYDYLGFEMDEVEPDSNRVAEATGVLVPVRDLDGAVRWRLVPRSRSDLVLEPETGGETASARGQGLLDDLDQLGGAERLVQEADVGGRRARLEDRVGGDPSRHVDDLRVRALEGVVEGHLRAEDVGKDEVGDEDVHADALLADQVQRAVSGGGRVDDVPAGSQGGGEGGEEILVVVHHEQANVSVSAFSFVLPGASVASAGAHSVSPVIENGASDRRTPGSGDPRSDDSIGALFEGSRPHDIRSTETPGDVRRDRAVAVRDADGGEPDLFLNHAITVRVPRGAERPLRSAPSAAAAPREGEAHG